MDIQPQEIKAYINAGGKSPYQEWLHSLKDVKTRARIRQRVDRLELGNFGDCESAGDGVYELRLDFGPGYRIYCSNPLVKTMDFQSKTFSKILRHVPCLMTGSSFWTRI